MASYHDEHGLLSAAREEAHGASSSVATPPEAGTGDDTGHFQAERMHALEALLASFHEMIEGHEGFADLAAGGGQARPPASKAWIAALEVVYPTASEVESELQCPVCLLQFERKHETHELDCKHLFHTDCIIPWLKKSNNCPLCREEFPTDDKVYEEKRLEALRKEEREAAMEKLHDSMFG